MLQKQLINYAALLVALSQLPSTWAEDLNQAVRRAQDEVRRFPKDAQKYADLAVLYGDRGDRTKPIDLLRQAVALPGGDKAVHYDLLVHYLAEDKQFKAALSVAQDDVKANPNSPQALFTRAAIYIHFTQYGQALADCNQALKRLPPGDRTLRPRVTARRGRVYVCTEQWAKAIPDLSAGIAADPTNSNFYNDRGFCLLKEGQPQAALADLQKSINLHPDRREAYFTRAGYYEQTHQYDRAIADLSAVLERNHHKMDKSLYERRIKLYDLTGQKSLAEKDRTTVKQWDSTMKDLFKTIQ